jgi:hypothetical protein
MTNKKLLFGIDFDGTFGADPALFHAFVQMIHSRGHEAVLVTQRTEEWRAAVEEAVQNCIPIVFAGGFTKREAARRRGYNVDIWMDDNPMSVDNALTYVGR